ncbi:MAG: AI-2E family transporter [Planctomycetaceae bacterium]|nr:AI-2E family transporter [Planctomycetaceae bacterium]
MTPVEEHNSPVFNALIAAAAFVVVVSGIYAARIIVIPFLLAIFIAVILSAILSWLRERGIKTSVAVTLMILILGTMGTLMVAVVGASVNELVRKLPQINQAVKAQEEKYSRWIEEHGISLDRKEKSETPAQTLDIYVPGLVPAPEKTTPDTPSPLVPEGLPGPVEVEPKPQPLEKPEPSTEVKPESDGIPTPETSEESSGPPVPTPAAESDSAVEEPSGSEPVSTPSTDAKPVQEAAPPAAELPLPTFEEAPSFELLAPNYIFGQQKHVIKLLPSTESGEIRSPYSGFLGNYTPVMIFRSFLDSVMGMFNYALIVFLMLLFLLLEWSRFGQKLETLPGDTQSHVAQVTEILASIRRYMLIKTMVSLLTGLLITIWLLLMGTSYALLWGTVAFLFNYIPTIGSIIAGIVPTLFVLVDQGPIEALWVAVAFLVVNFLIGNVLEPRIMGEGLGLSTFVVFLSLVFWGFVLGPVGMLLAVPLTMAIKIALGSDERTRWISVLLGSGKGLDMPEKSVIQAGCDRSGG